MPEALRLKVPKDKYRETLEYLNGRLEELENNKRELGTYIGRLQGDTFSGSDVQEAIDLAETTLKGVEKAIENIKNQRNTIADYLEHTESEALTFKADVNNIRNELPDMFK